VGPNLKNLHVVLVLMSIGKTRHLAVGLPQVANVPRPFDLCFRGTTTCPMILIICTLINSIGWIVALTYKISDGQKIF
jgi:hypothetical protein